MCPPQAAAIRHRTGQDRLCPAAVTNTARGRTGCISPLSLCVTGNAELTLPHTALSSTCSLLLLQNVPPKKSDSFPGGQRCSRHFSLCNPGAAAIPAWSSKRIVFTPRPVNQNHQLGILYSRAMEEQGLYFVLFPRSSTPLYLNSAT